MKFLKSRFGTRKKEGPPIRAQHKNAAYFANEEQRIDEWMARSQADDAALIRDGGTLKSSHYHSYVSLNRKKIEVRYSAGTWDFAELADCTSAATDMLVKSWDEFFCSSDDVLNLASLALLLDLPATATRELAALANPPGGSKANQAWQPDGFISYLLHLSQGGSKTWEKPPKQAVRKSFAPLMLLNTMNRETATECLKDYLDIYYEANREAPWYETHKRVWGYSGYWCWEAGALGKCLDLDHEVLRGSPFYPYDLAAPPPA